MGLRTVGALVFLGSGCFDPASSVPTAEPPSGAAGASSETPPPGPDATPAAVDTPDPGGSRLRAIWIAAEDGSRERVPGRWYDTELDRECSFALAADGVLRCLPAAGSAISTYYLSATCAPGARLFLRLAASCVGEADLGAEPSTACPTTTPIFRTRAYAGDIWVLGSDGTCSPAEPLAGFTYAERTEELAPAGFVSATREVE